jgi:hypothetical protein
MTELIPELDEEEDKDKDEDEVEDEREVSTTFSSVDGHGPTPVQYAFFLYSHSEGCSVATIQDPR